MIISGEGKVVVMGIDKTDKTGGDNGNGSCTGHAVEAMPAAGQRGLEAESISEVLVVLARGRACWGCKINSEKG